MFRRATQVGPAATTVTRRPPASARIRFFPSVAQDPHCGPGNRTIGLRGFTLVFSSRCFPRARVGPTLSYAARSAFSRPASPFFRSRGPVHRPASSDHRLRLPPSRLFFPRIVSSSPLPVSPSRFRADRIPAPFTLLFFVRLPGQRRFIPLRRGPPAGLAPYRFFGEPPGREYRSPPLLVLSFFFYWRWLSS